VPVFAQPSTKSVETVLIDDFDSAEEKDYQWDVQASRFVADGFPKKGYFKGIPNSLRGFYGTKSKNIRFSIARCTSIFTCNSHDNR
jgi:hypothetical protein